MEIDIIEPGYYYHIYNRGINRTTIFSEDIHYYRFITLCKKYLNQKMDILAYCLLPNHFHFLVYIKDEYPDRVPTPCQGNFSLPVSHLCNSYAQWYNKTTGRTGGLFQRPFKRKRISDEKYLKQVIYYIHRNPMHHNLAERPENWLYSSYSSVFNGQSALTDSTQLFEWFDNKENFIDYHKMQFAIDIEMFESE
jgi:REP element-mobilizing transposase RayT